MRTGWSADPGQAELGACIVFVAVSKEKDKRLPDLLNRLVKLSRDDKFIYRGCDSANGTKGMETSLYREYRGGLEYWQCRNQLGGGENAGCRKYKHPHNGNQECLDYRECREYRRANRDAARGLSFSEVSIPLEIERNIVDPARPYFPVGAKNIEIMTELRHYGQRLNILDFTRNLFVALFFACRSKPNEDGWVFFLESGQTKTDIDLDGSGGCYLVEPVLTQMSQKRVVAQSSIFAHAPSGRIGKNQLKQIKIEHDLKNEILDYLDEVHNITERTLFSDLLGLIDANSRFDKSCLHSGMRMIRKREYQRAVESFTVAISQNPRWAEAYTHRSSAYGELGSLELALEDINRAMELDPNNPMILYHRSVINLDKHEYKAAFRDASKLIRLQPDSVNARLLRATIATNMKDGKLEVALADLGEAIKLQPKNVGACLIQRGKIFEKLNRPEQAIECYRELIRLKPRSSWAQFKLGELCLRLNKHDEAVKHCQEAIRVAPDKLWGYYGLGNCFYDKGMLDEATPHYQKAADIILASDSPSSDDTRPIVRDLTNKFRKIAAAESEKKSDDSDQAA